MKRMFGVLFVLAVPAIVLFRRMRNVPEFDTWEQFMASSRVRCDECGDWACAAHQGHIGENCDCWPCDDCGDLSDELKDGFCPKCLPVQPDPYLDSLQ